MPWARGEFRKKHWHDASDAQEAKAASIAEGMIRAGVKEGIAIATGIARAKHGGKKGKK